MASPVISVCIPTYNRAARLQQIIDHLLRSSVAELEIVVSDDASTDDTPAVMATYADDPRIRYIRQPENIGLWPNWNVVVKEAAAPLVFRLDDDDYVDDTFLERVVAFFDRHPDLICLFTGYAYTRGYAFEADLEVVDRGVFAGRETVPGYELIKAYLQHNPFPGIHPAAVVFRREAAATVGYYRDSYNDHTFALALAACGDVGYLPQVHFYYVQHDDARVSNTMGAADPRDAIAAYDPLDAVKRVYESDFAPLREHPELQAIKDQVYRHHLRIYPCINFYTVRNNYHRRDLVLHSFRSLRRLYPSIGRDPLVWSALLLMMMPMPIVRAVMKWYRTRSG
jgi:glycosyltransferase involved in cell wall biosynthesis